MALHRSFTLTFFLLTTFIASAQKDSLRFEISRLAHSLDAKVSVSILHIQTGDTLSYNGNLMHPMLSVYKLPIAMAVLNQVDNGNAKMDEMVTFKQDLIHPGDEEVFSQENFPDKKIPVQDLLSLMLVYGSNTACDILFSKIIEPQKVEKYIHNLGVKNITIANTEREIQSSDEIRYKNSSTANSLVQLLIWASKKGILSEVSSAFLWEKMAASVTGPDRIKGMLPNGTRVAHRTGTASNGFNDVGVITLPDGSHLAIAVFISDANENPATCNSAIAKIARLAWNHYQSKAGKSTMR